MATDYEENGITVKIEREHDKPTTCKVFLNPQMSICREFVLACLKAYSDKQDRTKVPVLKCLDAFGATGIGGLQWKRHLGSLVEVTINEISDETLEEIRANCVRNSFEPRAAPLPVGFNVHRPLPERPPVGDKDIDLLAADANVTLHLRQFNFIHLDPYGSTVNFLDATFRNVYNNGIVVVTSTDIASLYGKCPQVTVRNYGAYMQRTDYFKEAAARILLAAIAKTAARCCKGIQILYTVAVKHFVQVAVRIRRGAAHADEALTNIQHLLHCQMCEQCVFRPAIHTVTENLYDLLPCNCHHEHPGKTAVEMGPMWSGELYDVEFLEQMQTAATDLKLSDGLKSLLSAMKVEARCPLEDVNTSTKTPHAGKRDGKQNSGGSPMEVDKSENCDSGDHSIAVSRMEPSTGTTDSDHCNRTVSSEHGSSTKGLKNGCDSQASSVVDACRKGELASEQGDLGGTSCPSTTLTVSSKEDADCAGGRGSGGGCKRQSSASSSSSSSGGEPPVKKPRRTTLTPDCKMPAFYYDVHRRKIKGLDLPKANKFVSLLHAEGFRASRTTFDPNAIRTNATLKELKDVIFLHCSRTKRPQT